MLILAVKDSPDTSKLCDEEAKPGHFSKVFNAPEIVIVWENNCPTLNIVKAMVEISK